MRKGALLLLGLLLVTGCTAVRTPTPPPPAPPKPLERYIRTTVGWDTYFVPLAPGVDEAYFLAAVETPAGIAWLAPQPRTGEGLFWHPTEPPRLYLSPAVKGGGELIPGAQEIYTFPLTVPDAYSGKDQYVTGLQLASAGDWVAVFLGLRVPGNNGGPSRLDAVNLSTHEHKVLTDARNGGGGFFKWRAEPNRVYWEQSETAGAGVKVTASKMIDLMTGEVSDVPEGTAVKP